MKPHEPWFVYLLRCSDNSLYCGITNDVERRLAAHNAGTGARYTRSRGPVAVAWLMEVADKRAAMSVEMLVKQMGKAEKEGMVTEYSGSGLAGDVGE